MVDLSHTMARGILLSYGVWMLRRAACLVIVIACGACGADASDAGSASQDSTSTETLPLHEVSGLVNAGDHFVAIGDRTTRVITFRLDGDKVVGVEKHDPLPRASSETGSQFEAVTIDGKGHVVVLSETGKVIVLDSKCETVLSKSSMDWQSVNSLVDGRIEVNSLGEGAVVLSKDHLLVALEKHPTALVEFGPSGSDPIGFIAGTKLTASFSPPDDLVALHVWKVDDNDAPDISELTVGPDGALWALTQQGNGILRFERNLHPTEEKASVKDHHDLPDKIKGAEGLAFDGMNPVVARDRSAESKNVFILDPIQ